MPGVECSRRTLGECCTLFKVEDGLQGKVCTWPTPGKCQIRLLQARCEAEGASHMWPTATDVTLQDVTG